MKRICTCLLACLLLFFIFGGDQVGAQVDPWPEYPQVDANDRHSIIRGPGGYFASWKLILIAGVFLVWIKLADWVNRDAIKFHTQHELHPNVWNPIVLLMFLLGLFGAVINIPFFVLGFPVYVLCAIGPWLTFVMMRRGKVDPTLLEKQEGGDEEIQTLDLPIDFKPAGDSPEHAQANLIRARQNEIFEQTAQMLYDAVLRRTEQIFFNYTKDQVDRKMKIDGAWIPMETLDRYTGDAMLTSLKYLANLNPEDRRSMQSGRFRTKVRRFEVSNILSTQGVPTGERATLKFETEQKQPMEISALGMWPDMYKKFKSIIDSNGYIVISSPPGHGLSTTWKATLHGSDRYVRDWVSVVDQNEYESEMENIEAFVYDTSQGQSPMDLLPSILLKQPIGFVVPDPKNSETIDLLSQEVIENDRIVVSRIRANDAVEAVLRLMLMSKQNRPRFIKAVRLGICQRLLRRLCDSCKQAMPPNPKLIQQLGGDPKDPPTIYTHFQKPPPEQLVDDKGRPIEIAPCQTCGGIGYIGRIAVFEMLFVNDAIRQAILQEAKLESVQKAARAQGHLNLIQQGYRLVLEGVTSISEIQRVMK